MIENILIKAKNIYKSYKNGNNVLSVLEKISFEIKERDFVTVVGPSGIGKSTLLNIIGTLDKPDSGSIQFDGLDLFKMNDAQLSNLRLNKIGFVFQFHRLLPEFSALENVMIPQMLNGLDKFEAADRAGQLLAMVGLQDRVDHRPGLLSGGEQQRVAIARAVSNAARVLLADEPTGKLDPDTAKDVFGHLAAITRATQTAALVVTHNQRLALNMDSILTIENGHVVELA